MSAAKGSSPHRNSYVRTPRACQSAQSSYPLQARFAALTQTSTARPYAWPSIISGETYDSVPAIVV